MEEGCLCVCNAHEQARKIGQPLPTPTAHAGRVKDVDVVVSCEEGRKGGEWGLTTALMYALPST